MKMVIAIVQDDDTLDCIEELNDRDFRVTKLATTGGFLKSGNTTLMIGVEKEKVEDVIEIIKDVCRMRKEMIPTPTNISNGTGMYMPYQMEVEVGGGTIFVIDVDQFIKV